jgi:hypothetical protein
MSHFTVLVLFHEKPGNIEAEVESALEPFSEELEVDEYEQPCWCIGNIARNEANLVSRPKIEAARETFKSPEWDRTKRMFPPKPVERAWKEHIKPITDEAQKSEKEHPLYKQPDPECDECKGSGVVKATHNPEGYWDWYEIGGRWSGMLPGKKNHTTLKRAIRAIQENVDEDDNDAPCAFTYALLADGEWLARGKMLMFGMSDDKNYTWDTDYAKFCSKYLGEHPMAYAVLVDCHS